ncbi:hypothetical protein AMECASPLE_037276, partial [Ameca splendens]
MALCNRWTGLISLSLILVAGLFLCLKQDPQEAIPHQKRWTSDGTHLRPLTEGHDTHPFLQNYWYRYVFDTAKTQNKTDCYVCSIMPVHSQGPTIYVKAMNDSQANCASSFGALGYARRDQFILPGQFPAANQSLNYTCNPHNCTCPDFWRAFNITEEEKVSPFNAYLKDIKQH